MQFTDLDIYRAVYLESNSPTCLLSSSGEILDTNPAHNQLYCSSECQNRGKSFSFGLSPTQFTELLNQVQCGDQYKKNVKLTLQNKAKVFAEIFATGIKNKDSEVSAIIVTSRNLARRRDSDSQLLRFRRMVEESNDAFFVIDAATSNIIDFNKKVRELWGYSPEEMLKLKVIDLNPNYLSLVEWSQRVKSIQKNKASYFETTHQAKSGRIFPVEISHQYIEEDGCGYIIAVVRDISDRRAAEEKRLELEEQIRQKYKMEAVGLMAGGIAHNFNNSLAIILGNLEMAQRKFSEPDKVKDYIENAQTAVLRSRDLVNQILTYSRKGIPEKAPVKLSIIVDEILKLLRSTNPTTVTLNANIFTTDDALVFADSSQIQEALINLYNNAIHAMGEKGEINITLETVELSQEDIPVPYDRPSGVYAKLSIQDSGCGIEEDQQGKIFDPFYTTKKIGEGTGMGLSTVQGIVEQHEGLIKVHSSPDIGTTFELYFPRIKGHQLLPVIQEEPCQGSGNILLVDDEEMLIDLIEQMLTDLGYKVTAVTSGQQALELLKNNPDKFDLVFTDQAMPEMTGKELSQKIKQLGFSLPIVLCSGYHSPIDNQDIAAFCSKPIRLSELSKVVRTVIANNSSTLRHENCPDNRRSNNTQ